MTSSSQKIFALLLLLVLAVLATLWRYTPPDDALRHTAKAVSERSWEDILVLREGIYRGFDTHPGWHFLLEQLHRHLDWNTDELLRFSVAFLFFCATAAGLFLFQQALVWPLVLALAAWCEPILFDRLFGGRPLLITMGCSLGVIGLFEAQRRADRRFWPSMLLTVLLAALAVFCHSTWYLLALPLTAFCIAQPGPSALAYSASIGLGILVGAVLTGHPIDYLFYQGQHLYWSLLDPESRSGLVGELQPYAGWRPFFLIVLAITLTGWLSRKRFRFPGLRNSWLILGMLGLALGFRSARFWTDWGFPCLAVWLGLLLEAAWMDFLPKKSWPAVLLLFLSGAALILGLQQTIARTPLAWHEYLAQGMAADPEILNWLPSPGGVVYVSDLRCFYHLFQVLPQGRWRYAPGFEPGLLPPALSSRYRAWRASKSSADFCRYAELIQPGDRLLFLQETTPPPECGLQWHFWSPCFWVGKTMLCPAP